MNPEKAGIDRAISTADKQVLLAGYTCSKCDSRGIHGFALGWLPLDISL